MTVISRIFLLLTIMVFYTCSASRISNDGHFTILKNVNVIDVENGELLPAQTVVLKDSLIHFIGEEWTVPRASTAITIDGTDKYLLPGLWDMHFHLAWEESNEELLFQLLLRHGITGVRDMGGDLFIQREMKKSVMTDPTYGPEIFGAGPILDGNPPVMYDFSIPLDDLSTVEKILDSLVVAGADFFKTYSLLKEPVLQRIADYSHKHDLSFAGHLSEYIEPERSIALGQKSIEHLNRLDEIWQSDASRIARIASLMKEKETWLCPTLVIYALKTQMKDTTIFRPHYDLYIHPLLQQEWQTSRARRLATNTLEDWNKQERLFIEQQKLIAFFHQQGVQFLAGSDFAGMPYVYPGLGLYQEMVLLHKAGLTQAEVLATATINPARFMSLQDSYGSVSVGKYADLVLLRSNPLENIEAVEQVESVFRKGRAVLNKDWLASYRKKL